MAVAARVRAQGTTPSRLRPAVVVAEMPRQHRPVAGRVHTYAVLRALADAEGGRLHYSAIQLRLTLAAGKPVSALNILLHDLEEDRLVLKLPAKAGYEITPAGRRALEGLEVFQTAASSTRNQGVGVR